MGEDSWREVRVGRNGLRALVSVQDYDLVAQYRWHVAPRGPRGVIYARRNWLEPREHQDGGSPSRLRVQYMHSLITGWPYVDHINHDGLDNRRSNLRPATRAQNSRNQRPQANRASHFKGVTWHNFSQNWHAHIKVSGRVYSLGYYKDETQAGLAYDIAAEICFGEYACLNRPEIGEFQWSDRFWDRIRRLPAVTAADAPPGHTRNE